MKRVLVGAGATAVIMMTAACGNAVSTSVKGEVGLTRGTNGHVTALVATCGSSVTLVDVASSREGSKPDQTNPELGVYEAVKPVSGTIRLDLEGENSGWKTTKPFAPSKVATNSVIVSGFNRAADSETQQTTATREQLGALKPGQVLRHNGSTVPEDNFASSACS